MEPMENSKPSLELVSYQVTELKTILTEFTRKIDQQLAQSLDRIVSLEKDHIKIDQRVDGVESRMTELEKLMTQNNPLPTFAKLALGALGILSTLIGIIFAFTQWHQ